MTTKNRRPLRPATRLALGERSYPVYVGADALERAPLPKPARPGATLAVLLADARLGSARARTRKALRRAGYRVREIAVAAGEGLKDFPKIYPLFGRLLAAGATRDSVLFALGGGTLGDVGGFVAATYLRGIRWVGLPTTLLAQVDSALGGKTGVNHRAGKNLIGAFHQPTAVVSDLGFLATLPDREIVSGLGEVVKYGLIASPRFLDWIARHRARLLARDPRALAEAVRKSSAFKARAVVRDELDRSGVREALNFGHTLAHALESATGYRRYRHGEAVLIGMRFAIALSEIRGHLAPARGRALDRLLAAFPTPTVPRGLTPRRLHGYMQKDKKVREGRIRFVLLARPGAVVLDRGVAYADVAAAYARLRERMGTA